MAFSNNLTSFIADNSIGTYVTPVFGFGMEQPLKSPLEPTGYRTIFVFKQVGSGAVNGYRRFTVDQNGDLVVTASADDSTPTNLVNAFKLLPEYGLFNTMTSTDYDAVVSLLA